MGFAQRVHEARRAAGLTIEQLAEKSGIAYTTLRRRLSGAVGQFTLDELDAIAEATNASFDYVLSGTGTLTAEPLAAAAVAS
jgi:transcriptional regulator with XRE-family HTH domain